MQKRKPNTIYNSNVVALQPHRDKSSYTDSLIPKDSKISSSQRSWLLRGLSQPGGKLPLFDREGQRINHRTIKSCIRKGWAEPWFDNPINPDWLVCKLTDKGKSIIDP